MTGEAPRESGRQRLIKGLDARSSFFLFGYYLRALEDSAGSRPFSAGGVLRMRRQLDLMHETASRSAQIQPLCAEIADVARLVGERTAGSGRMEDGLALLLDRCARRWFRFVRELPRKGNSLAVDIAFNLELAGQQELSADLYESLLCLESGAFRASRLMSRRAVEKALSRAGAPATAGPARKLSWCVGQGLIAKSDMRSAIANHCDDSESPEGIDDYEAESALQAAVRLSKKLLAPAIEDGLRKAMASGAGAKGPD